MSTTFGQGILAGKSAYVAGGTRGMNLAIAKRFASQGARVAVMSRSEERCAQAAAELEALGTQALGLPADARDYDRVEETLAQAAEAFGGLDVLVNNASTSVSGLLETLGDDQLMERLTGKTLASMRCSRAALHHLRRSGSGRIICIGGLVNRCLFVSISNGYRNCMSIGLTVCCSCDYYYALIVGTRASRTLVIRCAGECQLSIAGTNRE